MTFQQNESVIFLPKVVDFWVHKSVIYITFFASIIHIFNVFICVHKLPFCVVWVRPCHPDMTSVVHKPGHHMAITGLQCTGEIWPGNGMTTRHIFCRMTFIAIVYTAKITKSSQRLKNLIWDLSRFPQWTPDSEVILRTCSRHVDSLGIQHLVNRSPCTGI